jgi:predicted transglutaminase-like cysteine proteinase
MERIAFGAPVLAPVAHVRFCIQYPWDCDVHRKWLPPYNVKLTPERLRELVEIDQDVNRSIVPHPNQDGVLAERWLLSPMSGECHDYAVTKRHEILVRGWPSRALLLAEVETRGGERHLVLVVRVEDSDLVLDNLSAYIRPWTRTPYQWVRIQSPDNPVFWSSLARAPASGA